eukprot:2764334-Prymnesium_polylepis.1
MRLGPFGALSPARTVSNFDAVYRILIRGRGTAWSRSTHFPREKCCFRTFRTTLKNEEQERCCVRTFRLNVKEVEHICWPRVGRGPRPLTTAVQVYSGRTPVGETT